MPAGRLHQSSEQIDHDCTTPHWLYAPQCIMKPNFQSCHSSSLRTTSGSVTGTYGSVFSAAPATPTAFTAADTPNNLQNSLRCIAIPSLLALTRLQVPHAKSY